MMTAVYHDGVDCVFGEENMFSFLKYQPDDPPPARLRCSWCGSDDTVPRGSSGTYYCPRCSRLFRDASEVPFDVIANQWTPALGVLQAAGDIVAVRLPCGFYGVCLLPEVIECVAGETSRTGHARDSTASRGHVGPRVRRG
jgi:hypothetical protein